MWGCAPFAAAGGTGGFGARSGNAAAAQTVLLTVKAMIARKARWRQNFECRKSRRCALAGGQKSGAEEAKFLICIRMPRVCQKPKMA